MYKLECAYSEDSDQSAQSRQSLSLFSLKKKTLVSGYPKSAYRRLRGCGLSQTVWMWPIVGCVDAAYQRLRKCGLSRLCACSLSKTVRMWHIEDCADAAYRSLLGCCLSKTARMWPIEDCADATYRIHNMFFLKVVMWHINLKRMNHRTKCKYEL